MSVTSDKSVAALKAMRKPIRGSLPLEKDSDAHRAVVKAIRAGAETKELQKATGQPRQCIAAIRAHITMDTYDY